MNTIVLDEITDKHDAQAISEMIWEILQAKGINAEDFSYTITVNYSAALTQSRTGYPHDGIPF
tara:strand:- start:305 stop:493 length:189 start_codon:yes stop_codon:yes gene_type:complete